jgi:hypothetical protein
LQEICVTAIDRESVKLLVQRLGVDFGGERVSLATRRHEVPLRPEAGSGSIARALEPVERWIDEAGLRRARVRIEGRNSPHDPAESLATRQPTSWAVPPRPTTVVDRALPGPSD